MVFAEVCRIEVALYGLAALLFAALASGSVLKSAEFVLRSESGNVLQNVRARPEVRIPLVHRKAVLLSRLRALAHARLPLAFLAAFAKDRDRLFGGDFTPQRLLMNRFILCVRDVALMLEAPNNARGSPGLFCRSAGVFRGLSHAKHYIPTTTSRHRQDQGGVCRASYRSTSIRASGH